MDNKSYSKEHEHAQPGAGAGPGIMTAQPPAYSTAMAYPVSGSGSEGYGQSAPYNPYAPAQMPMPIDQQPGHSYTGVVQPTVATVAPFPQYGFTAPGGQQGGTASGSVQAPYFYEPKPEDAAAVAYRNDISDALEFCEKSIRLAFIRKVYSLLSLQLLVTSGIIALFVFHEGVRAFAKGNMTFYLSMYILFIVFMVVLICPCCGNVARKSPANYICLSIFTVVTGLMLGVLCAQFKLEVVALAGGSTVLICLGLTLFAFQTKWDFTRLNGSLFVILLVFVIFGFFTAFLRARFPLANMIYAGIGVLLFSVYLVHDTQLMMGGKHKYALSPEEYIFATLNIYLDIITIFLYLLRLFATE